MHSVSWFVAMWVWSGFMIAVGFGMGRVLPRYEDMGFELGDDIGLDEFGDPIKREVYPDVNPHFPKHDLS